MSTKLDANQVLKAVYDPDNNALKVTGGGSGLAATDGLYSLANTSDSSKLQKWDLSGQSASTTLTISPQNTSNMILHIPQVATASGAGMALVQDETTGFIFSNGITSSIGGANSMMQLADATTANRAQIKLHSYFNGASVAGVSTLTSRSGTIAVNSSISAGQDYSKWTAQAAAATAGSAPISGTFAFKANAINSLTVPSDFHIQLTNTAGTLGDRLYLTSEGLLQLPGYSAGAAIFDGSGNVSSVAPGTSGNVLTSNGTTWTSAALSAANTSLSNLANPTNINRTLTPSTNFTFDLGTSTKAWATTYTNRIAYNSAFISIDIANRALKDTSGINSLQWDDTTNLISVKHFVPSLANTYNLGSAANPWNNIYINAAKDSTGVSEIDFAGRALVDSSNNASVDWEGGNLSTGGGLRLSWSGNALYNSLGNTSVDWENGILYDTAAGTAISFGVPGHISMPQNTGTAVLVAGTATVSFPAISSTTSLVFVTSNIDGGTPGFLRVNNIVDATSFDIVSSSATDTSTVAWMVINNA